MEVEGCRELNEADLAATGHAESASAIAKGLSQRARAESPGYWIQIGGASVFAADEIANGRYGQPSNLVYDDLEDTGKIQSIIKNSPKRVVENMIISQPSSSLKTALLICPLIYGTGRGSCNQRSIQVPEIAKSTLRLGHGFRLGAGLNAWSTIHIQDLGNQIFSLLRAAVSNKPGLWNTDGIYCLENGRMVRCPKNM